MAGVRRGGIAETDDVDYEGREVRTHHAVPPGRCGHRVARGADRAAHEADQLPHRAHAGAQEGLLQPTWAVEAGQPAGRPAQVPAPNRPGKVPGGHWQTRSAEVSPPASVPSPKAPSLKSANLA